jgi:AmmeMemoRadiSam system protein B
VDLSQRPKLRPVEAFPVEHQGRKLLCLRDPVGLAEQPMLVSVGASFVLAYFDGEHSLLDIQYEYTRRWGEILPSEKLRELIGALDEAYFLESPRFAARLEQVREDFRAASSRPAAHAGLCYAEQPEPLRAELQGYFKAPDGPGYPPAAALDEAPAAGLIAPHIDPRRGGIAYAHGYAQLAARQMPELFVILGTAHCGGGPELFAATAKDYSTPLGTVKTDRGFVERLAARYRAGDLLADELLHRNEHSIEFQSLFLAWAFGTQGYQIVPILVSSFHDLVESLTTPARDERVGAFIEALREEIDAQPRRVCIIAGVDFAHIGKKFGDSHGAGPEVLQWVEREDREMIGSIERSDPEGFFAHVAKDRDRRRICGLAPMYTQLELLRGRKGRLLKYDIAAEPATESAVSFASMVIE